MIGEKLKGDWLFRNFQSLWKMGSTKWKWIFHPVFLILSLWYGRDCFHEPTLSSSKSRWFALAVVVALYLFTLTSVSPPSANNTYGKQADNTQFNAIQSMQLRRWWDCCYRWSIISPNILSCSIIPPQISTSVAAEDSVDPLRPIVSMIRSSNNSVGESFVHITLLLRIIFFRSCEW